MRARARPGDARTRRPTSAWVLLSTVAPELRGVGGLLRRRCGQAGRGARRDAQRGDAREADDLLRDATTFLALVETTLGLLADSPLRPGLSPGRVTPTAVSDPFVHLHVASGYSMRHGASTPAALVERAAEHGMDTLALTDRDGAYGAVKFVTACMQHGVRPVLGDRPRCCPRRGSLAGALEDAGAWRCRTSTRGCRA